MTLLAAAEKDSRNWLRPVPIVVLAARTKVANYQTSRIKAAWKS
jgi:hypothetical protein